MKKRSKPAATRRTAPKRAKPRSHVAPAARAKRAPSVAARRESLAPRNNGIASTRDTIGLLSDEDAQLLARRCREAALAKKAENVVMLDIRKRSNFCDYFVVATGRSLIQARAVADAVVEACEDEFGSPVRTEGYDEGGWILVDYGPVIVHVFLPQTREFYNLERLWGKPPAVAKRAT
jgi:ribosome-associated protein